MTSQAFAPGTAFGTAPVLSTNATLIGLIVGIDTAPEFSRTAVETTHSASTGGWKTFIPGDIKDGGMLAVTCQYDTQLDYKTLFAAGCDTVTITFPKHPTACAAALPTTAATFACGVVFEKLSPKWEFDSLMVITITFKLSGAATYVAAVV